MFILKLLLKYFSSLKILIYIKSLKIKVNYVDRYYKNLKYLSKIIKYTNYTNYKMLINILQLD